MEVPKKLENYKIKYNSHPAVEMKLTRVEEKINEIIDYLYFREEWVAGKEDSHPSDAEMEKYYCGGLAPGCEEECKGHKIVKDVYEVLKKDNDELKDLVKEDFLK